MMTAAFFAAVRPLFGGKMSQSQVAGCEALLTATAGLHLTHRAYLLATAHHETGAKMVPNRESLNYSVDGLLNTFGRHRITAAQARKYGRTKTRMANQKAIANAVYGGEWGRKHLGNTQPDDGWNFRGGGYAHTTGRTNFERVRKATGVDVVSNPDRILDPRISCVALVQACVEGWYTGKKLSDYLPGDYVGARRVVNGTDKAQEIARLAQGYEAALRALGAANTPGKPTPKPVPVYPPAPAATSSATPGGLVVAALIAVALVAVYLLKG